MSHMQIDQVIEWAEINSGTTHQEGVERMARALIPLFTSLGATLQRIPLPPLETLDGRGDPSLLPLTDLVRFSIRPDAPIQLLLCGHLDTVYPADSPFQHCSWLPNGMLNGPGVADMKGGLAILLSALQSLESSPQKERIGWRVLLNPDEEMGSLSSAPYLQQEARSAHLGLIFEPSLPSGHLVSGRKGSANFTLVAKGLSAHVGRNPEEGRSAINGLLDLLQVVRTLANQETLLNLGRIRGGEAVNQVADRATCQLNLRGYQLEEAASNLQTIVRELDGKNGIALSLHGSITRPPKPFDAKQRPLFEQIRQCGKELGIEIEWQESGGVCDGNLVAAQGIPVVDTLGARGGALHSPNEWLDPESLAERSQLTALFLEKLALGELPCPN